MPFVEVKGVRGVFSRDEKKRIIEDVTGVFAQIKSDEFATGVWVVVNELDEGSWGEGGTVICTDNV